MIISLIGKRGAGKTTIARALCRTMGFERLSFAGELRLECQRRYPTVDFSDDTIKDTPQDALDGRTPRDVLIQVGTHEIRAKDPDFWLNRVRSIVEEHPDKNFVIDDGRFANELEWLASVGMMIRVEAPFCEPDDPSEPSEADRIRLQWTLPFTHVHNPKTPGSEERVVQCIKHMIPRYLRNRGLL